MNILQSAAQHLHDHFVPNARNDYKPHLVAHRSLSLYAGLLISVKVLSLFSLGLLPQNQAFSSAITIRNILELTNYSRQGYALTQLQENAKLDSAAQAKAEDMLRNQYFAHVSPQGINPWDFIKASGYNYIIAGENLAINFYTAEGVSDAWMNSPEHKANILNKDFQDIGIGIAAGDYHGAKAMFVVQMFGASAEQQFIPQNNFSTPRPLAQKSSSVIMPAARGTSLEKPLINNPGFYLTNKKQFQLSGIANGATNVYVLVNHNPQAEFAVVNASFSGTISLEDGNNAINVVAFDSAAQASPASETLMLKLDASAPQILKTDVTPAYSGENIAYKIEVQTQRDPVKLVASLGAESILLQPTGDPNVWSGSIAAAATDLQNKMTITAYDLAGNSTLAQVATFSNSLTSTYGFMAAHNFNVDIFGKTFSASAFNNFYIYFVLALLIMLLLSIAIRRNVQHLPLIAHTSGMIVLALIFWVI
jgi:uncharacterized protein YkwD